MPGDKHSDTTSSSSIDRGKSIMTPDDRKREGLMAKARKENFEQTVQKLDNRVETLRKTYDSLNKEKFQENYATRKHYYRQDRSKLIHDIDTHNTSVENQNKKLQEKSKSLHNQYKSNTYDKSNVPPYMDWTDMDDLELKLDVAPTTSEDW